MDHFDTHELHLSLAGYQSRLETGYDSKAHSLAIVWRKALFDKIGERVVRFDELTIGDDDGGTVDLSLPSLAKLSLNPLAGRRTGLSRMTRNVGLAVALRFKDRPQDGIILATHHLFYHPRFIYERCRQLGLHLREIRRFRDASDIWHDWPIILAGGVLALPCLLVT